MATIRDLAKHTGFSVTTISRVLNNDPTLTPEDLYEMYSTDFPHLRPDDYERICRDYRMLWKEYEEYKLINDNGYENEKILS